MGLSRLAERPPVGSQRRFGDGGHPDVDGDPAVAKLRRLRLRSSGSRAIPSSRAIPRRSPTPKGFPLSSAAGISESLQKTLEAMQFGQLSAEKAQATAQADAAQILERNAK